MCFIHIQKIYMFMHIKLKICFIHIKLKVCLYTSNLDILYTLKLKYGSYTHQTQDMFIHINQEHVNTH